MPGVSDHDGEGALPDAPRFGHTGCAFDRLLQRRGDHAALQCALAVDREHEHRGGLAPDRADEGGDQAILERLLREDQEHEQRDRSDEQREARLGSPYLSEG